jgi:uncharacterized membrane protein
MQIIKWILRFITTLSIIVVVALCPYFASTICKFHEDNIVISWLFGFMVICFFLFIVLISSFLFVAADSFNQWCLKKIEKQFKQRNKETFKRSRT